MTRHGAFGNYTVCFICCSQR